MENDEFRQWAHRAAEWAADYRKTVAARPVRPRTQPGEIAARLPSSPPESGEAMDTIFADFENLVLPGMTHWQHPRFFAYFPANASPASILAEYLASTLAAQCMLWQTSPAATELETVTLDWLRQALGLPDLFTGVIQDSASSATLCAVLTMRERSLAWRGNRQGLAEMPPLRIYCSEQVHTSIDRAVWVAGIGSDNLVKIPVRGARHGLDLAMLEAAIEADRAAGLRPAGIIGCLGGTSIGASDDIAGLAETARRHGLFLHVDAAWAGAAMICPEFRRLWAGIENVDSLVVNPHKWLGAQFDCSAHYVREPDDLVRALAIRPDYLETRGHENLINYSEWSVPLGRRFRALKLWFVLRAHGLAALRGMIRNHVAWSRQLAERIAACEDFELLTPPFLSLFTFRHAPPHVDDPEELDALNQRLLDAINDDGRLYLSQTRVEGRFAIRFQVGQFETTREDVASALDVIRQCAAQLPATWLSPE